MLRGTTTFKCTDCGNTFHGPDIEWRATTFTTPCGCPQCGSFHTMPQGAILQKSIYKKIWKSIEETQNQQQ